MFNRGDHVNHHNFGLGRVELDLGSTVIARFEHGLEECLKGELKRQASPLQALEQAQIHPPAETLLHLQAELITSINDTWGVFARSRITLLPHQLWVCRQVLSHWPPRWLVADDVGLGKTIEAGLILWPLLSRRRVRRLLVICPASLVEQWESRLRLMFDIRLSPYHPDLDHGRTDYWNSHHQVVASLQTLRDNHKGRHERLLSAEPWDLVIVDEAHHLNVDERTGATLGYSLVHKMLEAGRVEGLLLFSATPHRGKDHGFLSLLHLLRPELFSVIDPLSGQLKQLPTVMIRNNKQSVTDLKGEKLFRPSRVVAETFSYAPAEERFYAMLTDFIATGKAYASTLEASGGQTVMLVLIALQKLASSSVAAVRRAMKGRLARVQGRAAQLEKGRAQLEKYREAQQWTDSEEVSALEERLADWASWIKLMQGEQARLEELVAAADEVCQETKIQTILATLEGRFQGRSILFFTEYKATQSLLMGELIRRYGREAVTFINGDGRVDDVLGESFFSGRHEAAAKFNSGQVRFLVATEAAGEGIDLQGNCHTLIHVDLPWNPMRLHQRVGRLNRYGQTKQVEVLTVRNETTVESLIWEKLNDKLALIMQAFNTVMDEPEDLLQIVLGMTSPAFFTQMFAEGGSVPRENINEWFNARTGSFGGEDVVNVVKNLIGHSASFDYQQVSSLIPRVDLADLKPFLQGAVRFHQRKVSDDVHLSFTTPDTWAREIGVLRNYKELTFQRDQGDLGKMVGIGHKALDVALAEMRASNSSVTVLSAQPGARSVLLYQVIDRVTSKGVGERGALVGLIPGTPPIMLRDWEVLQQLNQLNISRQEVSANLPQHAHAEVLQGQQHLEQHLADLQLGLTSPQVEFFGGVWFASVPGMVVSGPSVPSAV